MTKRSIVCLTGIVVCATSLVWWYGALQCLNQECHAHAILTGSMEPAVPMGSIIIVRRELPTAYRSGDVVSLVYPGKDRAIVTHRIKRVFTYPTGVRGVETKGDANTSGDAWTTSLGAIIGRQVAVIPGLGYAVIALHTRYGLVGVSACVASLVVFLLVSFLGRFNCKAQT